MTALGRRITEETIRDMRRSMPPEEFAREFMVWWEDPVAEAGDAVLDLNQWATPTSDGGCLNPAAKAPDRFTLWLDVSPDRRSATIGLAGDGTGDRVLVLTTTVAVDQVVPALQSLRRKGEVVGKVALQPAGQAGALIPDLIEAGIDHEPVTGVTAGQSCGYFIRAVEEGRVEHVGQDDFDKAAANAITRFSDEAELWDRRDRKVNIGPVVAGSGAALRWSHLRTDRPPAPPRRARSAPARTDTPAKRPARRRASDLNTVGF